MFCLVNANASNSCNGSDVAGHCTVYLVEGTIACNKKRWCAYKNCHNPEPVAADIKRTINPIKRSKRKSQ